MTTSQPRQSVSSWGVSTWLRVALGAGILTLVLVWVTRESAFLHNLSAEVILVSSILSILTCVAHALILVAIARAHRRELGMFQALRITALGSLANAAGGLPVGTAIKYSILHRQIRLTLWQITTGLLIFTVGISASLSLYAVTAALFLKFPLSGIILGIFALAVLAVLGSLLISHTSRGGFRLRAALGTLADTQGLVLVAGISFLAATSLVLNSCIVGILMLPAYDVSELIFISASGVLVGILSLLQSVAGIQEIAMAAAAQLTRGQPADGAQIALTVRATAVIASILIMTLQYLLLARRKSSN